MTHQRMTVLALGLGLVAAIGSASSAHAWSKSFAGTRDQVRVACANAGGMLLEDVNQTSCWNQKKDTQVTCDSDGACEGTGPGTGPNRVASIEGLFSTRAGVSAPGGSLSGSGGDSAPPAVTGGPAPFQVFATPQPPFQVMGQVN